MQITKQTNKQTAKVTDLQADNAGRSATFVAIVLCDQVSRDLICEGIKRLEQECPKGRSLSVDHKGFAALDHMTCP